ncbi:MAG: ribonuclease R [Rhizobiales bacterium]|nr:ribonuclease R [Hyphomicrobiales bacterium]NRB14875.1 ribonuclease R [Hyphomicrobiales bacterium]
MSKSFFPSKAEIIDYINSGVGRIGKRDIAKAFGIKGDNRTKLKHLLRELINSGDVVYEHRVFQNSKGLPPVITCAIDELTEDGDYTLAPLSSEVINRNNLRIILPNKEAKNLKPGDKALVRVKKTGAENGIEIYTAKLIKKIGSSANGQVLGIFYIDEDAAPHEKHIKLGFIEPVDKKDHNQYRVTSIASGLEVEDGDLVSFELPKSRSRYKGASITQRHGSPKGEKALSLIALHAHEIPHIFPDEVIAEAEACQDVGNSAVERNRREDLTDLPFVTIDPADAKDHDDALYAELDTAKDNPNGYKIYVAIADVSTYIKPFSAMDKEAFKRGNSVYFPDQVVPMLPERISNNLCSLIENQVRPSMVAIIRVSAKGKRLGQKFVRALIRSHAKLSYQQAQQAFDGDLGEVDADIYNYSLAPLLKAYKCLCIARDNRQPLALDLPERKIILDENGLVKDVIIPKRLEAHKLVEECMVLANVAAAEVLEKRKQPLIYRIHEQPNLTKVEALNEFLRDLSIQMTQKGELAPHMFNSILAHAKNHSNSEMINISVLRAQMQAVYSPNNVGHFGLNLRKYAHFTSPIRRYADLIVHRALIAALGIGDDGLTDTEVERLDDIAEHISTTERRAMKAERDTKDRLIAEFLSEKIGATFAARISGVIHAGLFLELSETGADGFVPKSSLQGLFIFDEASKTLFDRKHRSGYRMGDNVEVELKEANASNGSLLFKMLSPSAKIANLPSGNGERSGYRQRNDSRSKPPRRSKPGVNEPRRKKPKKTTPKHKRKLATKT